MQLSCEGSLTHCTNFFVPCCVIGGSTRIHCPNQISTRRSARLQTMTPSRCKTQYMCYTILLYQCAVTNAAIRACKLIHIVNQECTHILYHRYTCKTMRTDNGQDILTDWSLTAKMCQPPPYVLGVIITGNQAHADTQHVH